MRKAFLFIAIITTLAIDWAVLHDILKKEPDPYGEYLVLAISFAVFIAIILTKMSGQTFLSES